MKTPIVDYHIHSEYSFDHSESTPGGIFDICQEAVKKRVSQIAITDHLEANTMSCGEVAMFDVDKLRQEIIKAKDYFRGQLDIIYGIELGQPHQAPEFANKILESNKYEFVIGSYHNNLGVEDFYYIDYTTTPPQTLVKYYKDYLIETCQHIKWGIGKFSTLGHLGYPLRYFMQNNLDILNPYDPEYMKLMGEIFRLLIKNDIALEVNTSGLRQGMNNTMALDGMVQYYADMGGKLVTIGSDSHGVSFIGSYVEKEYDVLKKLGIKEISTFADGKRSGIKL